MDLLLNKYKYSQQRMQHYNNSNAAGKNSPLLTSKENNSNINFTGNPFKNIEKYKDILKKFGVGDVTSKINGILGDEFFSKTLKKAGITDLANEGDLKKLESSILRDTARTISYPFKNLWLDLGNGVATLFRKVGLSSVADNMQKPTGALGKRLQRVEKENSIELARNILEKFASCSDCDDIDKYADRFKEDVASNVSKIAKNYNSRDERTLNRMVTATVSALYSGADFYNISMLQKDDKKEAKKAQKGRFKQEMTRMLISAGTTFVTLGILDKYLKRSMVLNAMVIGASALLSEVGSRLINGTPLHPLTPKEAAKIAQKRNNKINSQKQTTETKTNNSKVSFKSKSQTEAIFSKFAQKDGSFAALNSIAMQNAKENVPNKQQDKKKHSIIKYLGLATLGCSAFYLALNGAKGEFGARIARKKLFDKNQDAIKKFLNNESSNIDTIKDELEKINSKQKDRANKVSILSKLKEIITKRKTSIDLSNLKKEVENLKNTKEGKKIEKILNQYIADIDKQIEKGKTLETKVSIPVVEGLYNGITKVVKTVYEILSLPGSAINAFFGKGFMGKGPFVESEDAFNKLNKKLSKRGGSKIEKELVELNTLINKKYKGKPEKVIDRIQRNTRNFETSAETGELANLSRTLVTAISTYFFVNDYGNKVLIESGGKNVEEANAERKERIAHKIANFIFNGTLMNTFNSIFKVPLNNSLTQAALIAATTETTNEFLIRKSICQPIGKKDSKESILKYEQEQLNKKGFMGWWSRTFKKLTGKKTLSQKAGVNNITNSNTTIKEDKKLAK